ncbi:DUF2834 domain-containing protein [Lysinibacillus pakistanensis]|uniref:DUF2834 domain-containing protein n=1 Tax=Lysinibacillus pakistanensis TaxID=759811 RepID=A0ABX6DC46_9BACI|nr:DUF2834 domain-containing protein [Lysinibacillus pakistanensis]
MRKAYLLFAIIGTVFPYYFLVQFLNKNGFDLGLLVDLLFANSISTFFAVDFFISCFVFIIFMFNESRKYNIKEKWICLLTLFTVGLSLALPLFLFFRQPYIKKEVSSNSNERT